MTFDPTVANNGKPTIGNKAMPFPSPSESVINTTVARERVRYPPWPAREMRLSCQSISLGGLSGKTLGEVLLIRALLEFIGGSALPAKDENQPGRLMWVKGNMRRPHFPLGSSILKSSKEG